MLSQSIWREAVQQKVSTEVWERVETVKYCMGMKWTMRRQQKNTRYPANRFTNGQGNTSQTAQKGLLTKGGEENLKLKCLN